jgi:hypothetical protein
MLPLAAPKHYLEDEVTTNAACGSEPYTDCGEQREVENGPGGAEGTIKQAVKYVGYACPQMNTTPWEQEGELIQFN